MKSSLPTLQQNIPLTRLDPGMPDFKENWTIPALLTECLHPWTNWTVESLILIEKTRKN